MLDVGNNTNFQEIGKNQRIMKIIYNNIIPPRGYKAITILNVVFVRKGLVMCDKDINHENIHWEQEKELLIVGFYLLYVIEFIVRLMMIRSWHKAYRSISFERECYANERNLSYIENRKHYSWIKYIK
jgi:hypothetical protein